MRRLNVDLQDVAIAFEDHGSELSHYLDMQTGRVVSIGADDFSEIDEDDDELREDELREDDYEGAELASESDGIRAEHALRAEDKGRCLSFRSRGCVRSPPNVMLAGAGVRKLSSFCAWPTCLSLLSLVDSKGRFIHERVT